MTLTASNRPNISSDLCQIVRQKIVDGTLPAGGHVNEVHLAEKLAVSRTPLREAMSQLTSEGLLECKPRRGFFATNLTVDEVEQLYPLRAFLDPKALRLAGTISKRRISELRRINEQIARVRRQPGRAIDLDDRWHRMLLSDCPNRILLNFIDQLIWKTRRYEYAYLAKSENIKMATDEHEAIIVALEQSDLATACKMLRHNMTSAKEPLIAWLQTREETE